MTTQREYSGLKRELRLISSSEDPALWTHPQLDLYSLAELANKKKFEPLPVQSARLYLIPSNFGEEYEPGFEPVPTSASELPELHTWTMKFAVSVIEIWAGRRQPAQLISRFHRHTYMELLKQVGSQKEIGRIRTIHQSEPLDGICESTVTVRYGDRLRAMVIRFEGVDKRWLCTELRLI
mgnify:FL=1|jgi:hypothetical protein